MPLTIGLLQQGSNIGQFAGPLVLGIAVETYGWQAAGLLMATLAAAGLALSVLLPKSTSRTIRPAQERFAEHTGRTDVMKAPAE